jgi:hypothetical protein
VKGWIRISIKVQVQKLYRLKIEPWRAGTLTMKAPGGSKWRPGGSVCQRKQIPITLKKSLIRIKVESWIRIMNRIKVMWIRNFDLRRGSQRRRNTWSKMAALSLFRFFRRAFSLRPRDESEPKWRNKFRKHND